MHTTIVNIFVAVITAVIVAITRPHARYAFAVTTVKLVVFASDVLVDTHTTFVYKLRVIVALAFSSGVRSGMTTLSASAVVYGARVNRTFLPVFRVNRYVSRRIVQPLNDFDHIATSVFFRSVHTPQLQICPIYIAPVHG